MRKKFTTSVFFFNFENNTNTVYTSVYTVLVLTTFVPETNKNSADGDNSLSIELANGKFILKIYNDENTKIAHNLELLIGCYGL